LWLKQHPDKNSKHIPPKIGVLLRETKLPDDIYKIIHEIIMRDELENNTSSDSIEIYRVPEGERKIATKTWNNIIQSIINNYQELVQEPLVISTPLFRDLMQNKLEKIVRDDIIEFWMKKQMMELLWMLENPEQSMTHMPKQPHSAVKSATPQFMENLRSLIEEGKIKFMMNNSLLNSWFENVINENEVFVNEIHTMKQHMKEEQAHRNYQYSIKKLNPDVFDELFIKYIFMKYDN